MSKSEIYEPGSHFVMFWLLAAMATGAAAPCLLVPPTEALQRLTAAEADMDHRVIRLEKMVQRQEAMKHALRTDPQLTRRLALRDLRYNQQGQVLFVSAGPAQPEDVDDPAASSAAQVPAWIERLYPARWAMAYRNGFARQTILLLAVGVLIVALCLYGPQTSRPT